jgi:hypothetical protein
MSKSQQGRNEIGNLDKLNTETDSPLRTFGQLSEPEL